MMLKLPASLFFALIVIAALSPITEACPYLKTQAEAEDDQRRQLRDVPSIEIQPSPS